jgi:hypothetical protein
MAGDQGRIGDADAGSAIDALGRAGVESAATNVAAYAGGMMVGIARV